MMAIPPNNTQPGSRPGTNPYPWLKESNTMANTYTPLTRLLMSLMVPITELFAELMWSWMVIHLGIHIFLMSGILHLEGQQMDSRWVHLNWVKSDNGLNYTKIFAVRPSLGKNKNNSAWPITLINYNLPPEIWFQTENLIAVSVIPHGPKALDTFFFPLTEECKLLTQGVLTYDAEALQNFELHANSLTFSGDLPEISKLLCLQGHGTYSPCCSCLIQGKCIQGLIKVYR